MGSGMLPAGAYMTLEHEYILIFRKAGKRKFTSAAEKKHRRESAYFWEERNCWFSDLWDLKGTRQDLGIKDIRPRSAAFPFEIPCRLINMFSVKGDLVLDPFMGTGTSLIAAMASERSSIGVEIDEKLASEASSRLASLNLASLNKRMLERLERHRRFVKEAKAKGRDFKHFNNNLGMEVFTGQERDILFGSLIELSREGKWGFICRYQPV